MNEQEAREMDDADEATMRAQASLRRCRKERDALEKRCAGLEAMVGEIKRAWKEVRQDYVRLAQAPFGGIDTIDIALDTAPEVLAVDVHEVRPSVPDGWHQAVVAWKGPGHGIRVTVQTIPEHGKPEKGGG